MTLSVLEGNFLIASLFKCDISYLWRVSGPCVCVELLVEVNQTHHRCSQCHRRYMYFTLSSSKCKCVTVMAS